jgi:hypothetical protein
MSKSRWSLTPPLLLRAPERPYHPGKRLEDGAIRRDKVEVDREALRPRRRVGRRGLAGQVLEYPVKEFRHEGQVPYGGSYRTWIEDLRCLGEASERRSLHAELPAELLEVGEPPEVAA